MINSAQFVKKVQKLMAQRFEISIIIIHSWYESFSKINSLIITVKYNYSTCSRLLLLLFNTKINPAQDN